MSTDSGAPASDTDAVYGALDRVDEAVCAVDTEWQFTFVNAEAGALLGRGPEELLETTIWDAVPHVGDGRVGGKLREAMRTQAPVRFESYSEERERWFRVRIYPSEDGLTAFFYDITDERGAALDRQRQRRLFETVFEGTEDALVVADSDRCITDFNPAAAQLFGYDVADVVGESIAILYTDPSDFRRQGAERFTEQGYDGTETYVVEYQRADGTTFEGETLGTPLQATDGETLASLLSVRDASARIEWAQQVEARTDALQAFHDITTDDSRPSAEQIAALLELGADHLGLDAGVLSSVADGASTVEYAYGPDGLAQPGDRVDTAYLVGTDDLVAVSAVEASDRSPGDTDGSYIGTSVVVDGDRYGALEFTGATERSEPFTEGEKTFVRVLAQWVGKELSRQQNKERAAANRDRLRQIIDLLPQLVFAKNRDNEYILANQATADANGLPVAEIEGATDSDLVSSPAEARQFQADDIAVIESGERKEIAAEPMTVATGETRTFKTTKIPYDPVGNSDEAVLGIATDITAAKERERELEETTQRLTVALAGTNAGVWELNLDTKSVVYTDSMKQLFGLASGATESTFAEFIDLVHEDDRATVRDSLQQIREDGDTLQIEYRVRQDDGNWMWVEARAELLAGTETARRLVGIATDITERKERDAEIELQSAAMEVAMDGIAILDDDEYVYMNEAHAAIFDYDPDELVGAEWRDVYGGDEIARLQKEVFPVLADAGEWRGETLGRKRDGTSVHQDLGLSVLESGELICTNRDITAQKERERELQRQRSQLRALFDKSPDGIIVHDAEGAILDVNDTVVESLGYDRERLCSMSVADIEVGIEPSELRAVWSEMDRDDILKVESEHRRQNGETFPVEVWVNKTEVDGAERFIAVDRDITERKRREAELRTVKERLDLAVEGANLGVWDWDMETDEVTFNQQWASMLGLSLPDIEPTLDTWEDRVHPADVAAVEDELGAHIAGEKALYDCEHRMETESGDWKWIRDVGKIVARDDDGAPSRAVGIHLDITEEKESKLNLEAERDMFAQGPAVVFKWRNDDGWPVEYVSGNVADTFGYTAEELESGAVPYADLIHDDDLDRIAEEVGVQSDGTVDRFTHEPYRMVTRSGQVRWVTDNTKILRTDGEITHYLGYLIDITEQKRLETSLRESEQSLRELTEIASDTDQPFEDKLRALLELGTERLDIQYGFLNRMEQGTQHIVQVVGDHPDLRAGRSVPESETYCRKTIEQEVTLGIRDAVAEGWADDAAYERSDLGCYIGGTVTVDGEAYGTLCFADRESRDHAFDETERAFVELLVQWISYELTSETFERKLRDINETAQQLMTAESKAEIGSLVVENAKSVLDMQMTGVWWYDESTEQLVPECMSEESAAYITEQPTFERGSGLAWAAFDSGEVRVYNDLSTASGLVNPDTKLRSEASVPLGEHGIMTAGSLEPRAFSETDINLLEVLSSTVETALTRAEREAVLRRTQADLQRSNRELEQFAYAASHDLQEPLRTVSSYLTLIERRYGHALDGDASEFIEFAVDGADRMREMIQALLTYSRVGTSDDAFEPVALAALFDRVTDGLEVKIAETDATVSVPATAATVRGAETQLLQLFQNLVENGIKYNTGTPEVGLEITETDGMVSVAISDNGIGMAPDQTDAIFEVFQRLHTNEEFEGTGIGLSICRKIVDRHGGDIRVESSPGDGSTFTVTLPAGGERSE
ncbi:MULTISPECIES: PAS domain S-box protein [Haloarcula]|uniref:PAS domain S-box protein n=1 Tax=Haloarcula TaxID=2237 RepID=UPI0023E87B6B|nr:PAS domain S-box protein [Halomicroarcula sp. SHR3]